MLPGDYSAIERSEAARHAAALEETQRESDAFYAREHDSTLGTGSFLDDLLRDDAAYQNATSYHERNLSATYGYAKSLTSWRRASTPTRHAPARAWNATRKTSKEWTRRTCRSMTRAATW